MVTVKLGTKTEEKPFPKLMVSMMGNIVLFTSPEEGTCVNTGQSSHRVGEYSYRWAPDLFTDYNEPVTLQNA